MSILSGLKISWSSPWLLVPPILLGIGTVGFALANRQEPQQNPPEELATRLRVTNVIRSQIQPSVIGYGVVAPARVWSAVAEVDGRVIETHPDLHPGVSVGAGEMLLTIDPTDYELAIGQLEAEIALLKAQIVETERTDENNRATLEIEKESMDLATKELQRYNRLARQSISAPLEVDRLEREQLAQHRRVQELENALNLIPIKLQQFEANLRGAENRLAIARRDLDRTTIHAPFECRLATVAIEPGQYVAPGQVLFEVHSVDAVEIEAQIPLDEFQLLAPDDRSPGMMTRESAAELVKGLDATVRIRSGDWVEEWPAELVRIRERVDQRTRSLGAVVRIDYQDAEPRVDRSTLLEGTFCEVELDGHPRFGQLLVPDVAVRNGTVLVVDDQNRLQRRAVKVRLVVDDQVAVTGDLREGERVVLSDPSPAVEGMLVDPVLVEWNKDGWLTVTSADEVSQ